MKVCISLRDHSTQDPRQGNLRSEARWERQALEACMSNPAITEIYTAGCRWHDGHKMTAKYKGMAYARNVSDMILLMQDWNTEIINYGFKAAVINIFSGPWLEQQDAVKEAFAKYNGNIWFTIGFPVMLRNELGIDKADRSAEGGLNHTSHLEKFLPRDHILCLPVPAAPYTTNTNNFDKKKLLWVSRLIFITQMADSLTLEWSLQKLVEDPTLHLEVLTGWLPSEVKTYINEQVVYVDDIAKGFWELEKFQKYAVVQDRVSFPLNLHWSDILAKYREAKLLTTHGKMFGGPPIEAGMHAVPFVGGLPTGALLDCPDYLYAPEPEACRLLDKLLTDQAYYEHIGNSYRVYVSDNYTYAAFNRNLNKLLADQGLL